MRSFFFLILLVFAWPYFFSQTTAPRHPSLHFRKEKQFYFFQAGIASDTIRRGQGDMFYLQVPDSLKDMISIAVENGRLLATANDSLVRLHFLPGVSYESRFHLSEKGWELKSQINGAAQLPRDMILITVSHRMRGRLITNRYVYAEQ